MPSLYVPPVAARNSASSIPSELLNIAIEGIVASPTPTIPISSDSISVTENRGTQKRASAAAAIHPAVPPPTTTIRRETRSLIRRLSGNPAASMRRRSRHSSVAAFGCSRRRRRRRRRRRSSLFGHRWRRQNRRRARRRRSRPAELVGCADHPAAAVTLIVDDLEVLARVRRHERLVGEIERLDVDRQAAQQRAGLEVVTDLRVDNRLWLGLAENVVLGKIGR